MDISVLPPLCPSLHPSESILSYPEAKAHSMLCLASSSAQVPCQGGRVCLTHFSPPSSWIILKPLPSQSLSLVLCSVVGQSILRGAAVPRVCTSYSGVKGETHYLHPMFLPPLGLEGLPLPSSLLCVWGCPLCPIPSPLPLAFTLRSSLVHEQLHETSWEEAARWCVLLYQPRASIFPSSPCPWIWSRSSSSPWEAPCVFKSPDPLQRHYYAMMVPLSLLQGLPGIDGKDGTPGIPGVKVRCQEGVLDVSRCSCILPSIRLSPCLFVPLQIRKFLPPLLVSHIPPSWSCSFADPGPPVFRLLVLWPGREGVSDLGSVMGTKGFSVPDMEASMTASTQPPTGILVAQAGYSGILGMPRWDPLLKQGATNGAVAWFSPLHCNCCMWKCSGLVQLRVPKALERLSHLHCAPSAQRASTPFCDLLCSWLLPSNSLLSPLQGSTGQPGRPGPPGHRGMAVSMGA